MNPQRSTCQKSLKHNLILLEPFSASLLGPKMGKYRHELMSTLALGYNTGNIATGIIRFNFTYLSLACISSVRRAFLYSLHTLCACVTMAFGAPVAIFRNLMTSSNYGLKSQINTNINGDDQKWASFKTNVKINLFTKRSVFGIRYWFIAICHFNSGSIL